MTLYDFTMEYNDIARIDKLCNLKDSSTFWDDVRKLTRRITSDHAIKHWQAFAEMRYNELLFEPRQRTALDGSTCWCIWDRRKNTWSTLLCHGKYNLKSDAIFAIYNTIGR